MEIQYLTYSDLHLPAWGDGFGVLTNQQSGQNVWKRCQNLGRASLAHSFVKVLSEGFDIFVLNTDTWMLRGRRGCYK